MESKKRKEKPFHQPDYIKYLGIDRTASSKGGKFNDVGVQCIRLLQSFPAEPVERRSHQIPLNPDAPKPTDLIKASMSNKLTFEEKEQIRCKVR